MSNFFTKLASSVGIVTLVAASTSVSLVAAASEFLAYAETLADNGVIASQSSEAGYRLSSNITRAELAKVVANLGAFDSVACTGDVYSDVGAAQGDLCGYIEALADAGVVSTAVATFRPDASVTRAEMVKMILGALGEDGSDVDAGYMDLNGLGDLAGYVNRANELGCASDSDYFRPNATSSRGEAFKIASCVADFGLPVDPVDPVPPTGTGVVSTGTVMGAATVAFADTERVTTDVDYGKPSAKYVPKNVSSVKVGSIKISATADTTVSSVVVTRSGLGNVADISSVQLFQNGISASDARTMSTTSQSATLKLNPSVVVKAGASVVFDVMVSLNGAENNQHQFAVTAVNATNGAVTGVPVTLGLLNTTSYTVGQVSNISIQAGSLISGKTNQLLATVKMTPNRDATVNGFTISKSTGEDYNKVIANAKAYFNGVTVGTVTVGTDKITVTGLNVARLSGEEASIEIRGDGVYVGPTSTVTFKINETTDVSATEKTTSYTMAVSGTFPTSVVSLPLNQVDIVMTKVSTGSMTVAPGTSSVELYNAKITSDATFDVSLFGLSVTGASLTNFVDDKVTVYIAGTDYEVTQTGITASASGKLFSSSADRFRVEPGTTVTVRVVGNVKSTAMTGSTYKFNFALYEAKNVTNGQTVALTKSLEGDIVTVNNGTFTVVKSPNTPTYKTVMEGSSTADLLWFDARASAENQTMKSVLVTSSGAFDTYATKVALMQGTREVKSFTDSATLSGTTVNFDTLSESLQKDISVPFSVRVTLKSGTVTTLGTSLKLTIATPGTDVVVGRAANTSTLTTTSSSVVTGNAYQVSSNAPSIALPAQVAKNTTVEFANASNYDVQVNSITYEMTRNAASNGSYVTWSGTSKFLDAINGNNVGTVVGPIPGSVTVTFAPGEVTVAAAPLARYIELVDPANTVQDDQYTVTIKSLTYQYKDRTTNALSSPITESYTVAK